DRCRMRERGIEVGRGRNEAWCDRKRTDQLRFEPAEELVVIERIESTERRQHVAVCAVVRRTLTRRIGQRRLEQIEEVYVAEGSQLIERAAIVLTERVDERHGRERLRQKAP